MRRAYVYRVVLSVLLVLSPFVATRWRNDGRLRRMSQTFSAVPHPTGTARVAEVPCVETFGNLMGVGNQCNYLLAEVRRHSGGREQEQRVREFYAGRTLTSPVTGKATPIRVIFASEVTADTPPSDPTLRFFHRDDVNGWGLAKAVAVPGRYLVYYEDGHEPGCDLRCH